MTGDLLVLASLVAGAAWVLLCRRLMHGARPYSPTITTIYTTIIGTIVLCAWVLATEGLPPFAVSATTWSSVIALGVAITVAPTLLWNWGLARVPVSRAALFINVQPIVGALLGIALFHDAWNLVTLIAGASVIAAAIAVTRAPADPLVGSRRLALFRSRISPPLSAPQAATSRAQPEHRR